MYLYLEKKTKMQAVKKAKEDKANMSSDAVSNILVATNSYTSIYLGKL